MSMAASPPRSELMAYVVMGVSGSGKSLVGQALAEALGLAFAEGDALHPKANVEKMSRGIPLDDADRLPWLDRIGEEIANALSTGKGIVISCSALKKIYRDQLRSFADGRLIFVFLKGSEELLAPRMAARTGHFMPPSLLKSQLATLEDPSAEDKVISVDISGTTAEVIAEVIFQVRAKTSI
ncbi:MAG: gntK [Rhizobium sp.]|nr:gntK [Rhizobium sp.]